MNEQQQMFTVVVVSVSSFPSSFLQNLFRGMPYFLLHCKFLFLLFIGRRRSTKQ